MEKLLKISAFKLHVLEHWLAPFALLAVRLHVGLIFWRSGMTKYTSSDGALSLFKTEYIPNWEKNHIKHWLGVDIPFPVPSAEFMAPMAMCTELACAVLLIIGLAGRFAAFCIFMVTLSVELFVYPDTSDHINWMLMLALIACLGPGKVSVDYFIRRAILKDGKRLAEVAA
jgi:putative oxidoreductase